MPRHQTPQHDRDAGGDPAVLDAKARLRAQTWQALTDNKAARFPGAEGRIPNFVGAELASERLRQTEAWQRATTIKANPDSPQWPVRQRALEGGKRVYMAVPRLASAEPFLLLDPDQLTVTPRQASSIKGASTHARPIGVDDLEPVDLVIAGSVAVDPTGARLGKGGGFSDLEFAIATEAGLIDEHTIVATTVHDLQVVQPNLIPVTNHDVRLDLIVTPSRTIDCRTADRKRNAARIDWEQLTEEKVAAIPYLRYLSESANRRNSSKARSPASRLSEGTQNTQRSTPIDS